MPDPLTEGLTYFREPPALDGERAPHYWSFLGGKMSEWISVRDAYPEISKDVVALKSCGPFVGHWTGWQWMNSTEGYNDVGVTHWMPIPDRPKPAPKPLTKTEALREAINLLDAARQSTMGRRELPLEAWFQWSSNIAMALPRLRAALESED